MTKKCKVCNRNYNENDMISIVKEGIEYCEDAIDDSDYYLTKNYVCKSCIEERLIDTAEQCFYDRCYETECDVAISSRDLYGYGQKYCKECANAQG